MTRKPHVDRNGTLWVPKPLNVDMRAVNGDRGTFVERTAICGACGCERLVTPFMRRDREQQFTARPAAGSDSFYCGCQNDDDFDM